MSNFCENLINVKLNNHFLASQCKKTIQIIASNLKSCEGVGEVDCHAAIRFSSSLVTCLGRMDSLVPAFCEYVARDLDFHEFELVNYASNKEEKASVSALIEFYKKAASGADVDESEFVLLNKKCAVVIERRNRNALDDIMASKYAASSAQSFIEACRESKIH